MFPFINPQPYLDDINERATLRAKVTALERENYWHERMQNLLAVEVAMLGGVVKEKQETIDRLESELRTRPQVHIHLNE